MLQIIPLEPFPIIKENDNIANIILQVAKEIGFQFEEKDILVIAQSIISRAEGQLVNLETIVPSAFALELAAQSNKDPRHIEVILHEAKNLCKFRNGVLVTETKHGFVCANSGVDRSNVPGEQVLSLLPIDPDRSAYEIRKILTKNLKKNIAIIISDTHNRPFRLGAINIAIGCAGLNPLKSYVKKQDLFGYTLKNSVTSVADQLCSAAGLVMGEADEGRPVIVIRGFPYEERKASAKELIRPVERDYFR